MASRQFRALFIGGSLLLLVAALSACGDGVRNNASELMANVYIHSLEIDSLEKGTDQCGVLDIAGDYVPNVGYSFATLFRQDRGAFLRHLHRPEDWGRLKHIVKDSRYSFVQGCISRWDMRFSSGFFLSPEPQLLCQITPFSESWDSGRIVSCINTETRRTTFGIDYDRYSSQSEMEADQCGVFDIIRDYEETGEFSYYKKGFIIHLRRDRNARLRLYHRNQDRHLLRYIVKDGRYSFAQGCRSEFRISTSIHDNPQGRPRWDHGLQNPRNLFIFSSAEPQLLCRITPFSNASDSGRIVSCINTATGRTTFKVERP